KPMRDLRVARLFYGPTPAIDRSPHARPPPGPRARRAGGVELRRRGGRPRRDPPHARRGGAAGAAPRDPVGGGPGTPPARPPRRGVRGPGRARRGGPPVLVYSQGGGGAICTPEPHAAPCRELANGAGCAVVSVDYRLAPEPRFPAAPEDCYAALSWVAKN